MIERAAPGAALLFLWPRGATFVLLSRGGGGGSNKEALLFLRLSGSTALVGVGGR